MCSVNLAHFCGFNIMEPLPSYWTYDRFLKNLDHTMLEEIMASLVKQLFESGIVDTSFIGIDSTPVAANTKLNNPKSFAKNVVPGSIILFHNAAKHTPKALPGIIEQLLAQGYKIVPVSQLLLREIIRSTTPEYSTCPENLTRPAFSAIMCKESGALP